MGTKQAKPFILTSAERAVLKLHKDTYVPKLQDPQRANIQKRLFNLELLFGGPDSFAITTEGLERIQEESGYEVHHRQRPRR